MALAGGVNVILSPSADIYFSRLAAMARGPEMRPFDAAADGYLRAEGCGIVLLKRLEDAMHDTDHVLAVIHGSAVNQDGRSAGLTAPNGQAQEAVLRATLADAGVDATDVAYAEAHGSATRLGDPIEAGALGAVYGQAPDRSAPLLVGSVKANIGHLESAAGIAGLIKVVNIMQRGEVPPQIGFTRPNEIIDMQALGIEVAPTARRFGAEVPLAGVSSFGFSGTNAHMLIGPPPDRNILNPSTDRPLVLPLSARSPASLKALKKETAARLKAGVPAGPLCRGMGQRREHARHRLCVAGSDAGALVSALERGRHEEKPNHAVRGPVFVFSGHGSQWAGMGAVLAAYPAADKRLDEIDAALSTMVPWTVRETMDRPETVPAPTTVTSQVGIFAAQLALDALFRNWGIAPAAVIGHSMGEVAAACCTGAIPLSEAVHLIVTRSRILAKAEGTGLMALVETPAEDVEARIRRTSRGVRHRGSQRSCNDSAQWGCGCDYGISRGLHGRGSFCPDREHGGSAGACAADRASRRRTGERPR